MCAINNIKWVPESLRILLAIVSASRSVARTRGVRYVGVMSSIVSDRRFPNTNTTLKQESIPVGRVPPA